MADIQNTTSGRRTAPLSALFSDKFVAAAFRRVERDNGDAFAIVPVRPLNLAGGAAENTEVEYA
jgi:hypothetical protein